MCWLSVDHADEILQAEAGQRLAIRKVHASGWVVRESELEQQRPAPVCLIDRTTVLFRFSEDQRSALQAAHAEAKAVFRMLNAPRRDVFQFSDGSVVAVDALPAKLIFDVLEIPGKEHLSAVLKKDHHEVEVSEAKADRKSWLGRVLQLL